MLFASFLSLGSPWPKLIFFDGNRLLGDDVDHVVNISILINHEVPVPG